MRRCLIGLLGVIVFAGCANAQHVEQIRISNAGIWWLETERIENAPTSIKGFFRIVKNMRLAERTDRIPAAVGTSLGINFQIIGEPNGAPVTIRYTTRFPSPGLRDPKTGKVLLTSENDRQHRIGETSFRSYSFDEDWEIVPGVWSLEFWHEGKLIAAQKFDVEKAVPMPDRIAMPPVDTPGER